MNVGDLVTSPRSFHAWVLNADPSITGTAHHSSLIFTWKPSDVGCVLFVNDITTLVVVRGIVGWVFTGNMRQVL